MNEGVHHMKAIEVGLFHKLKLKLVWAVLFFSVSVVSLNAYAAKYYYNTPSGSGPNDECSNESGNGRLFGSASGAANAGASNCLNWVNTIPSQYTQTSTATGVTLVNDFNSAEANTSSLWIVSTSFVMDFVSDSWQDIEGSSEVYLTVYRRAETAPLSFGVSPQGEYPRCENQPPAKTNNPIHIIMGNKYKYAVDLSASTISPISFQRHYNSHDKRSSDLGFSWRHNFEISVVASQDGKLATVNRPDGVSIEFNNFLNTGWVTDLGVSSTLSKTPTGWTYKTATKTELYNSQGQLTSIVNEQGRTLTLTYSGRLDTVTDDIGNQLTFTYTNSLLSNVTASDGRTWIYSYDVNNNLVLVTNPDNTFLQYNYENVSFIYYLTGITDERGIAVEHYEYDASGRAIASYKGNKTTTISERVEGVSIRYDGLPNKARQVTSSRGSTTTYDWGYKLGTTAITKITGPGCAACGSNGDSAYVYDNAFNVTSSSDNGVTTNYGNYDANGNYGYKEIAVGTPEQRRIDYTYDPRFYNKVSTKTEPSVAVGQSKVTTYIYDNFSNLTSLTINGFTPAGTPVSRTTTFTYNGPLNQLSEIDGPRTDVADITTIDYYLNDAGQGNNRARVQRITTGGIITRDNIQYSATGKVASEQRLNGLQIFNTYYAGNDRLQTTTQTASGVSRVTQFTYLASGEVESITTAAGSAAANTITLGYDAARRLTTVTDGSGNYISYTLDTEGNKEKQDMYDVNNVLQKSLTQVFDIYNRLDTSAQVNELMDYNFSPDGTLDNLVDGNNRTTQYTYDELERLTSITQDQNGTSVDTANALSQYGYDAGDNLTLVTDPINGTTTYAYDDLGNLLQQTSPDSGATQYTYDEAGNVATKLDANLQSFTYSYDALNRLLFVVSSDAADDKSYVYDTCLNGLGLLCSATQASSVETYSYNGFGNVAAHQGSQYIYDGVGRIGTMTYPSGNQVSYSYGSDGRVNQVIAVIDGVTQIIASNINYLPFGPATSLTYGNGAVLTQTFDNAYRMTAQTVQGIYQRAYSLYDANGNLLTIDDALSVNSQQFAYDALNRLTSSNGLWGNESFGYDKNSNRLQSIENGTASNFTYEPNSNRMDVAENNNVTLDANGNTLQQATKTYNYTTYNQLLSAIENNTLLGSYQYNALGQRVSKTTDVTQNFRYGLKGELLAELAANGTVLKEYIYLNGRPIAVQEYAATSTPTTPPVEVIMDDVDLGTSSTGIWERHGYGNPYNAGFSQSNSGGTFRFTPTLIASSYDVYARWNTSSTNGTQVPITIQAGGTSNIVTVNQQSNGSQWVLLGRYDFTGSGSEYVEIQDAGNGGYAVADAVQFTPVVAAPPAPNEVIIDDTDLATSLTGIWERHGYGNPYNAGFSQSNSGGTFRFTPTLSAGNYDVYAWWNISSGNSTQVPITIQASGANNTVTVNQQSNGAQWVLLGSYNFTGDGSEYVEVQDAGNGGYAVADAVRFIEVVEATPPPTPTPVTTAQLYYIHTDQLGTPRAISTSDATNKIVWRWNSDAFGKAVPNEDVDGDGTNFVMNLRFPGQYFDQETGLHYNYYRDYDPSTGRYIQSDPIGLAGGLNTYGYVGGNPLSYTDPMGLFLINPVTVAAAADVINGLGALFIGAKYVEASLDNSSPSDSQTNSKNQCKIEDGERCKELYKKINSIVKELFRRYMHQCRNKKNQWDSHLPAYNGKQSQLEKLVKEAESKNCFVPSKAYEWLNTPCPPAGTKTPSPGY